MKNNLRSLFKGKIIEVIHHDVPFQRDGKADHYTAEMARRSPGVRLLIVDEDKQQILLTKEKRAEVASEWDYRLPGGKVFDSLDAYLVHANDDVAMLQFAEQAADKECHEETGLKILDKKFLHKSVAGATIEWDLYYFLVSAFDVSKQTLESGEVIYPEWYNFDAVKQKCLNGDIQEDRSVAVIFRYLLGR